MVCGVVVGLYGVYGVGFGISFFLLLFMPFDSGAFWTFVIWFQRVYTFLNAFWFFFSAQRSVGESIHPGLQFAKEISLYLLSSVLLSLVDGTTQSIASSLFTRQTFKRANKLTPAGHSHA